MSMLQQILDQMFVDPEILNALDEEQKQILFIKMREEQVKRWEAFEMKRMENGEPECSKPKDNSRRISWLTGEDGEVWVWVMGEHKDDLTIEQITEKRALEEARQLAEKEMLENMHLTELTDDNAVVGPNEDENTLKEQLSRIRPWNSEYANNKIQILQLQDSIYDDADSLFGSPKNNNVHWLSRLTSTPELFWPRKGILKKSNDNLPSNNYIHKENKFSNDIHIEQLIPEKTCSLESFTDSLKSNGSDERSQVLPSTSTSSTNFNESFLVTPSSTNTSSGSEAMIGSYVPCSYYLPPSHQPSGSDICPIRGLGKEDVLTDCSSPYDMKKFSSPISATKPPWMNGNSSTGIFPTVPRSRLWNVNTQITSPQKMNFSDNTVVKFRPELSTGHDLSDIDEEISKRQSEIFEKIKEKHQQFEREAAQEAERAEQAWEEQKKKAREAEAQIRRIAQRAREQHRQQSLRTSSSILPVLNDANSSLKAIMKNVPRPPKPKSREAIINWFKAEELLRGTGLDPLTHRPAVWFHGIIRRSKADQLLQKKPPGSFLVRVSERIWGYTISYVVGNGNVKHFLVERIPQGYQFLGTNQIVHKHLHELVAFHEISPITVRGNEILRWAVGQMDIGFPDYADLIPPE
uniref:SH2 domain-containing protein n=1 Tax=Onchocerca volvulus TaxID=6282 RepID=A0A8R1XWZ6_ONCVO